MQFIINIPQISPIEKLSLIIKEIEEVFIKQGVPFEIKQMSGVSNDPWDNLDIDELAVDTGIKDFAENHDHYLYGEFSRYTIIKAR